MKEAKCKCWPFSGRWAGWMLVAVVLYVLSTGPVGWLTVRGFVPSGVGIIYRPIALLATRFDAVGQMLGWYIGFFGL